MNEQIIIGFDPGLAELGYGLIELAGSRISHLDHGLIRTSLEESEELRVLSLHVAISKVLLQYQPTVAGVESIFFSRNARSAIPVAQARGVILLACAQAGLRVCSFSPPQIKQRITGSGRADKLQMKRMVQFLLGLKTPLESDHVADALAAAYCVWQAESPLVMRP